MEKFGVLLMVFVLLTVNVYGSNPKREYVLKLTGYGVLMHVYSIVTVTCYLDRYVWSISDQFYFRFSNFQFSFCYVP